MGGVGLSYRVPVQIFWGTRLTYLDERTKLASSDSCANTHPKRSPSASKKFSQVTLPDSPTPPISTKRYRTNKRLYGWDNRVKTSYLFKRMNSLHTYSLTTYKATPLLYIDSLVEWATTNY